MKLYYKTLLFLSLIFISIFIISVFISIKILMNNQVKNISLFKNEFITSYTENFENLSQEFFANIESEYFNGKWASTGEIIEFIKSYFDQSVILLDLNGNQLYCSKGYEDIINYIVPKESFQLMIKNSLIKFFQ